MSYSAFVLCNCYQEGKTVDPPFKELVQLSDGGLYLAVPAEKDIVEVCKMDAEFDRWKHTACLHENMNWAHEYLSNLSGMASFKEILKRGTKT